MTDTPLSQARRRALIRLNPMVAPLHVYDEVVNCPTIEGLSRIIENASWFGWTK